MMNSDKSFPWEGSNKTFERARAADVNGIEMDLFNGIYEMAACRFEVIIKKGLNLKTKSYDLLRNFKHDNAIPLLDYYTDGKQVSFVIPKVDTSFEIWFQNEGCSQLFDHSGHMTLLFKSMIIDFCSLIGSLNKKGLIIEKFHPEDLYISMLHTKLLVLLTEVTKVGKGCSAVDEKKNWDHVRRFVSWCEEKCNVKMDALTESFVNFIGKTGFKVQNMKAYPDDWDYQMKGDYLMSLAASDRGSVIGFLRHAKIHWPFQNKSLVSASLPQLINDIIEWEQQHNRRLYSISQPISYIDLLRNLYMHHQKLPPDINLLRLF